MDLTRYFCKICGAPLKEYGEHLWRCEYCGNIYKDESVKKEAEDIVKNMLDSRKIETVNNLRKNLYDALQEKYTDSAEICRICSEIKKYLPEDFSACFYYTVNRGTPNEICKALCNLDSDIDHTQTEMLVLHTVKSLRTEYLLPLQNIVENTFKKSDLRKYEYLSTLISEEGEKINRGVYETSIPRDVFILYSSKDIDAVIELVSCLEENGLDCFVALRNLRHGRGSVQNYESALHEAIDSCRSVVFVSSKNSRSMECDALRVELKYIKNADILNAPAEYRQSYLKIPPVYKKKRVEYRLDSDVSQPHAEKVVNEFFSGLEYVYSPEAVLDRIYGFDDEITEEIPAKKDEKQSKFCVSCGTENIIETNFCAKCGKSEFVPTLNDYVSRLQKRLSDKIKVEEDERKKYEAEEARKAEEERKLREASVNCYNVGDTVKFGKYPQSNGIVKDIEWKVLAKNGNRALIISKYGLDCKKYHDISCAACTWETCMLRKWLNNDFYDTAFSSDEKEKIFKSTVPADKNPMYSTNPGNDTQDKLFLLSINEANVYFKSSKARACNPTAYAKGKGAYKNPANKNCVWWLRSPGQECFGAACVNSDGDIFEGGLGSHSDEISVRPALWVNTDNSVEEERKRREAEETRKAESKHRENETDASYFNFTMLKDSKCSIRLKDKKNYPEKLILPSEYNGMKVTSIGSSAFSNCKALKSISIPESVTSIGDSAFSDCSSLENINIPESVEMLVLNPFPCIPMKKISISPKNKYYRKEGNCIIENETGRLVCGDETSVIPSSVISIGDSAFYGCKALTRAIIPEGVTSIGENAFEACLSLKEINLPNSITAIESNAFHMCESLESIKLPESVTKIADYAFAFCVSLKDMIIPQGVTSIDEGTFSFCSSLASISIPRSVKSIDGRVFFNCDSLKKINYSGSKVDWEAIAKEDDFGEDYPDITVICKDGIYGEPEIKATDERYFDFTLLDNGTYGISSANIDTCPADVVLPSNYGNKNVTSVAEMAFYGCKRLKSIFIPDVIKEIGDSAFWGCTALKKSNIPKGVKTIAYCAFSTCTSLESINIPDSVKTIEEGAFAYCKSLRKISYSGTISKWKAIEKDEFWNDECKNITVVCTDGNITEKFIAD